MSQPDHRPTSAARGGVTSPNDARAPRPRPRDTVEGSGKLADRVVLVTGGDSGIGRSIAVLSAREGASVAIVHRPEEERAARDTVAAVESEGRHACRISGHVADAEFCERAVDTCVVELGGLDVLVNNGESRQPREGLEDLTLEQWDEVFRANVYGSFHMVRAAVPHMPPGAAIVQIGSTSGLQGDKELLDYSATKGAIHALTKSLAQNLAGHGIRVNCVAPGLVATTRDRPDPDRRSDDRVVLGDRVGIGRRVLPEHVAHAVMFFACEADSASVTGEVLTLSGAVSIGC